MEQQALIEQLVSFVTKLDEQQLIRVLRFAEAEAQSNPSQYNVDTDPILTGELRFDGDPNLASDSKKILRSEFGNRKPHTDLP
jgi:chemotaxis signal transduction protein